MSNSSPCDCSKLWDDLEKFFQEDYLEITEKQEDLEARADLLDSKIKQLDQRFKEYVKLHNELDEKVAKLDLHVLANEQKIESLQAPPAEEESMIEKLILDEEKIKSLASTGQNDNNSPGIISW